MVEKKEDKKINKIVKSIATKPNAKKINNAVKEKQIKKPQQTEQQFFVKELAERMGIGSYDLFLMKRDAGLKDDSLITMSEMQKLYNKIVGR